MPAQLTPHLNMGNICRRVSLLAASPSGRRSPAQQLPFLSVTDVRRVRVSWLLFVKKAFRHVSYSCSPSCLNPSETHWDPKFPLHGADAYFVELSSLMYFYCFHYKNKAMGYRTKMWMSCISATIMVMRPGVLTKVKSGFEQMQQLPVTSVSSIFSFYQFPHFLFPCHQMCSF